MKPLPVADLETFGVTVLKIENQNKSSFTGFADVNAENLYKNEIVQPTLYYFKQTDKK